VTHSYVPLPGLERKLEVLRLEFNRKNHQQISTSGEVGISPKNRKAVLREMKRLYPGFEFKEFDQVLSLLWRNNEHYVRISPHERIARILWVYQKGRKHNGLYFNVEKVEEIGHYRESRLLFSTENLVLWARSEITGFAVIECPGVLE